MIISNFNRIAKVCSVFCFVSLFFVLPVFSGDSALPGSSKVSIGGEGNSVEPEVELKMGDPAPDFTLPNLATDKMENLKDYLGKPIILFFIQSACYSCLQEAKALKTLKEQTPGVEVIAVGVDLLGKPMLVSWAAHNNINYPVLLDPIFSVPEKYGFSYTPSSVIINKDGKIAFIHSGFRADDIKLFENKINELLQKK
ncbi:MAG: TlpA family protein disulfide reductase [Candidatus Riflebacteria bacterium]|nr:TlpA family protein disulfide reductase [Candidatus Riflebacteria bacterium]